MGKDLTLKFVAINLMAYGSSNGVHLVKNEAEKSGVRPSRVKMVVSMAFFGFTDFH